MTKTEHTKHSNVKISLKLHHFCAYIYYTLKLILNSAVGQVYKYNNSIKYN